VSGDFYEVVERAAGAECVLMVADVSGKGLSASLLTGYLEALTSVPIEAGLAPHEVFNQISGPLLRRTPTDRFATVMMVVLTPGSGKLRWANAGHDPALLSRRSGSREWLEPTGMPLGLIEGAEYDLETTSSPVSAGALRTTTEARNPESEVRAPFRRLLHRDARRGARGIAYGLEGDKHLLRAGAASDTDAGHAAPEGGRRAEVERCPGRGPYPPRS
jgi:hypothetical protein